MIKVKSFYIYKDSLQDFDEKVQKYLRNENIAKEQIISVIPIYSSSLLGNTITAGIMFIYSK